LEALEEDLSDCEGNDELREKMRQILKDAKKKGMQSPEDLQESMREIGRVLDEEMQQRVLEIRAQMDQMSAEEKRFLEEKGVDFEEILKAMQLPE